MKKIFILGGTGSIGENVLSVIDSNKDKFELIGISAKDNTNKVQEIIHKYHPKYIYLDNATARKNIQKQENTKIIEDDEELFDIFNSNDIDIIIPQF
mgnify:FL=1